VLAFGSFINAIIKFVIVAFALFLVIKQFNNLKRMIEKQEEIPTATAIPADVALLTEIRDLLAKRPS
jgi:large conductance mechanosensitive channel